MTDKKTRILICGTHEAFEMLKPAFQPPDDYSLLWTDQPLVANPDVDWIVGFHYRHKVPTAILDEHPHHVLNIHPSLLPLNRGAHPDFWAWYDNTEHGITIHEMDEHIDTGPILVQTAVNVQTSAGHDGTRYTFADVYADLDTVAAYTFKGTWDDIKAGYMMPKAQPMGGTMHRVADLARVAYLLPQGWNTPVDLMTTLLKACKMGGYT